MCALLSCYLACTGNSLPKFCDNLSVTSSEVKSSSLCDYVCKFLQPTIFPKCPIVTIQPLRTYYFLIIHSVSEPVLFAEDTRVMIIDKNLEHLCSVSYLFRSHVFKCFISNNLVIRLDKMNIMKFITQNASHSTVHIGYEDEFKQETMNTNFLRLQIYININ